MKTRRIGPSRGFLVARLECVVWVLVIVSALVILPAIVAAIGRLT